jgi:hypothetical protein
MNRRTGVLAGLLLMVAPFLFGQEPQNQTNPRFPEDVLSYQQLVAWSWMQKPQPMPQPLPPADKGVPQPYPQTTQPANPQAQQEAPRQTFTGKIVKDGDRYVLKVGSNTAYQLDAQSDAKQYENQSVRIVGTLDTGSNTIRVVKIELFS